MAQFDVHRDAAKKGSSLLLVDLQSDLLQGLQTRVVAPAYPRAELDSPSRDLHPEFELDGERYVVSVTELAAVHRRELGPRVGTLGDRRTDLIRVLDLLFTGI